MNSRYLKLTQISRLLRYPKYFSQKKYFSKYDAKSTSREDSRLGQMGMCYLYAIGQKYPFYKKYPISQKKYFSKYDAKSASCWDSRLGQMEMCYLKLATFLPSIPLLLFTLDNISELQTAITHKISTQTAIYCPRGNKSLLFTKYIKSKIAKVNLSENWDAFYSSSLII